MRYQEIQAIAFAGLLAGCESSGTHAKQSPGNDAQAGDAASPTEPVPPREGDLTRDDSRSWGELQIAINPKNPKNIAYATVGLSYTRACLAANDPACQLVQAMISGLSGFSIPQPAGFFSKSNFSIVSVFYSFDRGVTWGRSDLPEHPAGSLQGDPSITVGPDGTFYASWDALNWGSPDNALASAGVGVSKSTDGGKTWSTPVLTGTPVDGPKVTADVVTGTVYAASSGALGPKATGDPTTPTGDVTSRWVASSEDGVTWTAPQPMGGQGGAMAAAHGMLATAFIASDQPSLFSAANAELCGNEPAPCTIFQTTKDGGQTWERHVMPVPVPSNSFDWPLVAADPAEEGHFAVGLIANQGAEYHIYHTHDSGATWTAPAVVTDDSSKSHFHGYLSYALRGGALGLVFRTWESEGKITVTNPLAISGINSPYSAWVAVSQDGGTTFSKPIKLSAQTSPAADTSTQFSSSGDDYSGLALDGDFVYAGWADWGGKERGDRFAGLPLDAFNQVDQ